MPDSAPPPSSQPASTAHLRVGQRVVVRYLLEHDEQGRASDVTGELRSLDADSLVVATRTGPVTVPRSSVVAAKHIPPRAARPGRAHERVSPGDLQTLMAKGWRGTDEAQLGDWVLRAAGGYTGRANSVLPVGDSTLSTDQAIDFCERWYRERNLPAIFQVFGPEGFRLDKGSGEGSGAVAAALLQRGYAVGGGRPDWAKVLVMTAESAAIAPLTEHSLPVVADARLSPQWLMAFTEHSGRVVPGITEQVLTGSEGQLFLHVVDPDQPTSGRVVAGMRVAIHPGWAGLYCTWTDAAFRRRGIAATMLSAAATVARENHMPALYLQVSADNPAGVQFWRDQGFTVHHEYTYLTAPPGAARSAPDGAA